jgi:hypothetical protein
MMNTPVYYLTDMETGGSCAPPGLYAPLDYELCDAVSLLPPRVRLFITRNRGSPTLWAPPVLARNASESV